MRNLNVRRLFGLLGIAALVGALSLAPSPSAASFDCPSGPTECVGTESADTLDDSDTTLTLRGLGGDDTITLDDDGGSSGTAKGTDNVFGGAGNDRFLILTEGDAEIVFGGDGDDSFKVPYLEGSAESSAQHALDGGRGDDFFQIERISPTVAVFDGPGSDTILMNDNFTPPEGGPSLVPDSHTIRLTADNEQDTVRGGSVPVKIELQKGSGRDVIDCGSGGGTVLLQGNRKATDTFGNNLRKAALRGGTAQTGCDTIIP